MPEQRLYWRDLAPWPVGGAVAVFLAERLGAGRAELGPFEAAVTGLFVGTVVGIPHAFSVRRARRQRDEFERMPLERKREQLRKTMRITLLMAIVGLVLLVIGFVTRSPVLFYHPLLFGLIGLLGHVFARRRLSRLE
jgi:hypothetical protein